MAFCLLLFLAAVAATPFTCKNEAGATVAWWTAIKFPNGYTYMYADVNSPSFAKSKNLMSDPSTGALSFTLNQIYNANKTGTPTSSAFVFYNDQKPSGSDSSSRGHTKGVVGLTQDGGFWLVHSVPGFPAMMSGGLYPGYNAAPDYGQSFLCMSLAFSQFNSIGTQFTYNFPQYYDWNMPTWVPSVLYSAVTTSQHTTAAVSNVLDLTTTPASLTFTSFAKTSNWNNYLYENLVAPYYKTDLYAETWMNGANPDPTFCKNATITYDVMNIRSLSSQGVSWTETQDHSKWVISTHDSLNRVCIGDINRQQSQNTRAGGTVCFVQSSQWTSFNNAIVTADSCPTFEKKMYMEMMEKEEKEKEKFTEE
jgi:deoxyribonuclease-2